MFRTVIVSRSTAVEKGNVCYVETNALPQAASNFEVVNKKYKQPYVWKIIIKNTALLNLPQDTGY
jgi:hypothetical protein